MDPAVCLANAKKSDPNAQLCQDIDAGMCAQPGVADNLYKYCHCQPPYAMPDGRPCERGANTPQIVLYDGGKKQCYCCCSCFSWNTPIMIPPGIEPGNVKSIQLFEIGDAVLAAGTDLKWQSYDVEFSDGIPPGPDYGKPMVTIYYMVDELVTSMVVTTDHAFLLANGKLKRADKLEVGKDKLALADGTGGTTVLGFEVGMWYGGIHHISTSNGVAKTTDGHLIGSNGIVSADWSLQIADIEGGKIKNAKIDSSASDPTITEDAYLKKHRGLVGHKFSLSVPNINLDEARPAYFVPYPDNGSKVPAFAKTFVTEKQAADILKNGKQEPASSNVGRDLLTYLFNLFNGFYPDVHFATQWEDNTPNAYSWEQYGVRFIVVNGGLVRMDGVGFNELAVVIAHELGHLYGGEPLSGNSGLSCEGQADYAAMASVLPNVFFISYLRPVMLDGLDGIEKLFALISPANQKGAPGNTCDMISIDCRKESFRAGIVRNVLPECAGGPKVVYLQVTGALAQSPKTTQRSFTTTVRVEFDMAIAMDSADHVQYYEFKPAAKVKKAEAVPGNPNAVQLTVEFAKQDKCKLTVKNVYSVSGIGLNDSTATVDVNWSVNINRNE